MQGGTYTGGDTKTLYKPIVFLLAGKPLIGSRANSGYTRRNPQLLLKKRLPHVMLCCGITTVQ